MKRYWLALPLALTLAACAPTSPRSTANARSEVDQQNKNLVHA